MKLHIRSSFRHQASIYVIRWMLQMQGSKKMLVYYGNIYALTMKKKSFWPPSLDQIQLIFRNFKVDTFVG